ncbi:MAG: AlbA family DNA-binding domain-containing protein [Lachnospiraceae bacterium]
MNYVEQKMTEQEVVKILEYQENHFLDMKSMKIKPAKLSESVSSFANASGGDIYIGIEEKK